MGNRGRGRYDRARWVADPCHSLPFGPRARSGRLPPVGRSRRIRVFVHDDLITRVGRGSADREQVQADALEDRRRHLRGELEVAAESVDRRHLTLFGRDRPQPEHQPTVLSHVTGREHTRHRSLHPVVHQYTTVDRDTGRFGQFGIGLDANGGQEKLARQFSPILENGALQRPVARRAIVSAP